MAWPDRLAAALDEEPLTDEEQQLLLELSRDVAHGTERRYAPLSSFLVGLALGRSARDDRRAELARFVGHVRLLLEEPSD